ncbi:MAG: peptidyl-prolyl cis-trans isomerase, partial [Desulfobacteraceae bacterium]|nr:peptidyl-prolyl cis-trans isomerase [Desulfobacteraceae bacterium]
ERLRQQFGNQLDDAMLESFQVEKQALDQVINTRLLADEAHRLHFTVTDQELVEAITAVKAFHVNGRFSQRQYERLLSLNRTTPEEFEQSQRQAMLLQRIRSWIERGVSVSETEARDFYNWQNARVKVDYVFFDTETYSDLNPTDEELRSYYEENKTSYRTQPQVRARYVRIDPADFLGSVQISDEAVAEYYDNHADSFFEPKRVEARHILFRLEPDASAEAVEEKRKKALDVLRQIREGADFAEMAKKYSEGPTGPEGGYLGIFAKEDMVAPFAEAAFSMEAGQVSEPVRTNFGWHLIRVEKVLPKGKKTLEEATDTIRSRLVEDRAKTLAYEAAESLFDATFETNELTEAAGETGNEVKETNWFSRSGPEDKVGDPTRFAAVAFNLDVGEISDVEEFGGSYFLLQLTDRKEASIPELEAVREKVRGDWIAAAKKKKAAGDAADFIQRLKAGKGFAEVAEAVKREVRSTDWFRRNEPVPDVGQEVRFTNAAFRLSAKQPYSEEPVEGQKGYYVLYFQDRKAPEAQEFEEQKQQISQILLRQKRMEAFESMLAGLKERSEITIEEAFRQ